MMKCCDACGMSVGSTNNVFVCRVCKYCVHLKECMQECYFSNRRSECDRCATEVVSPIDERMSSETTETLKKNGSSSQRKQQPLLVLAAKPHKVARLGEKYQCKTPKWTNKTPEKSWNGGSCKMNWCPRRLSEDDVNSYLKHFKASQQEHVLQCLHESNYNVAKALKSVSKKRKRVESWKEWTVEDKRTFNKAMAMLNDKHFDIIRETMPHKSISDLVQYYYGEWKFTKARKVWRDSCTKRKDYHDDVCYTCEIGGDLICCDTCHLAFHLDCCEPKIEMSDLTNGTPYSCKFCMYVLTFVAFLFFSLFHIRTRTHTHTQIRHELRTKGQRARSAKCVAHISEKLEKAKSWTSKQLLTMIDGELSEKINTSTPP